jgi:hypothetical protein
MESERNQLDMSLDTGSTEPAGEAPTRAITPSQNLLNAIKTVYPVRSGGHGWGALPRLLAVALRKGYSEQDLLDGAKKYRRYCDATGISGTAFVRMARTFYGQDEWFAEDYEIQGLAKPDPSFALEAKYDADATRLGEPKRQAGETLEQYRERLAVAIRRSLVRVVK